MTTVRELVVKVNIGGDAKAESKSLINGMTDVKSALELVAGAVKVVGKAFAAFTTDIATSGDEIAKNAKNIGISAESLQELGFAAKLAGASAREVQTAIQRMGKGLNDARRTGTGPFADALAQMGLSLEAFQGLSPDEAFTSLAESISKMEDPITRAALAQDVFGRGGKTLLPLLNEGREGIEAMRAEFKELGGGFTEDGAAASEEFVDSMLRMETVVDSIKISIGTELLPVIQKYIDRLRKWVSSNEKLIRTKLKEWLSSIIDLAEKLVPIVVLLAENWEIFAGLFIGGRIAAGVAAVTTGLTAMGFAASASLGPIGLIAGALAALIPIAIKAGSAFGDALGEGPKGVKVTREDVALGSQTFASPLIASRAGSFQKDIAREEGILEGLEAEGAGRFRISQAESRLRAAQKGLRKVQKENARVKKQQGEEDRAFAAVEAANASQGDQIDLLLDAVTEGGKKKLTGKRAKRFDKAAEILDAGGTFEEALGVVTTKRGGRGGKKAKAKAAEPAVTDEELFKLISKASASGVGLQDVLQGRKLAGGAPPVIAVQITNIDVQQAVNAPVNVTGVPGEDAEETARRVGLVMEDILQSEYKAAVEELPTLIKR